MGTLIRLEIRRVLRDPGFVIFAVLLPVALFLVFSNVFGGLAAGGVDTTTYLMISMAAYGGLTVALNVTGLVAHERRSGWNRQLRLTRLPGWGFVVSKAAVSMAVALPALALVLLAGWATGADPGGRWLPLLLVVWAGVLPFVAIGLLIGLLVSPEAQTGVSTAVGLGLAVLGGLFVPVEVLP
ncbi:MAG: ABC transporter permease, partial [Actinomycetia bacterium]|nr:ABC transporter permease [Actinomycetes bacterium]